MKRRLLLVTPFFAPQSHAAVFRAYKLAKYLETYDWEVHVLTVATNYAYNEDPSLLRELPPSVKVHAAKYVEPTARGLSYALGLSDRRFATLRSRRAEPPALPRASAPAAPALRQRLSRGLRTALNVPDAYWTWFLPALVQAHRIVSQYEIGVVLTSADPYTCHAIGYALQRAGLRWVADLRDPHTHCHRTHSRLPWVFAAQRELERLAAERADVVTVAAQSIAMILKESYGLADDRRLRFIPTGLDEALLDELPARRAKPYLIFCGEHLPDYGDALFQLFAKAQEEPEVRAKDYQFLVVGRREVNEPRLAPSVVRLGLQERVVFVDHLPQRELYGLIKGADFATLCYGERALWWCLPAKLVDYHALQKPVLAVLPNPSEARARLTETGLGIFLDGAAAQNTFNSALRRGPSCIVPNVDECARYLTSHQVARFAEALDEAGMARDR